MKRNKPDYGQIAKTIREESQLARLRPGEVPKLVTDTTNQLEKNVGRWHRIYFGRCRPGYLYLYNKERDRLDKRITMRGVTECMRGEKPYYYAMLLPGGVKGELIA